MPINNPFEYLLQEFQSEFKSIHERLDEISNQTSKVNLDQNLTVQDCAKKLNVSEQSIWNYIKRGLIPAKKIGRRYVISHSDLENALKEVKSLRYRR